MPLNTLNASWAYMVIASLARLGLRPMPRCVLALPSSRGAGVRIASRSSGGLGRRPMASQHAARAATGADAPGSEEGVGLAEDVFGAALEHVAVGEDHSVEVVLEEAIEAGAHRAFVSHGEAQQAV